MDKLIIVWNERLMFKHGIGLTSVEDLSVDLSLDDSTHLVVWLYKCVSSLTEEAECMFGKYNVKMSYDGILCVKLYLGDSLYGEVTYSKYTNVDWDLWRCMGLMKSQNKEAKFS
mgnify:FL=1